MTDDKRPADQHDDREPDEKLDDLEPTEDDSDALKGGGPREQTIQTGGAPGD